MHAVPTAMRGHASIPIPVPVPVPVPGHATTAGRANRAHLPAVHARAGGALALGAELVVDVRAQALAEVGDADGGVGYGDDEADDGEDCEDRERGARRVVVSRARVVLHVHPQELEEEVGEGC